jgi:hypothetical protein
VDPCRVAPILLALGLAAPAGAQVHALPPGPRPLHMRLAEADVVAIGTVAEIGAGRIAIVDAEALRGEASGRFEIKRSPSRPPPLAVGLSALLPLRGARSPYLLVDEPRELLVLEDEASVAVWRDAARQLLATRDDRRALLGLYLEWLDGPVESLRDAAGAALVDARSGLLPLPAEVAGERARAALDPDRPASARRTSAMLAGSDAGATSALLAAIPDEAPDPQVVELALRAGVARGDPGIEAALLRCLDHPDATVRRAAVGLARVANSEAVLARVREVAASDADENLRRHASDALQ